MINFCLFGAGRIGAIHAGNIAPHPDAQLKMIVDLERYDEAYRRELDHFIGAVAQGATPMVGGEDGIKALALADAALESLRRRRAVRI